MKFRINYNEVKKLKEFGVENYEIDRLENKMIDIVYYLGLSGKDLSYRFIVNKYEVSVDFCSREIIENVLFNQLVSYYKNVKMNIGFNGFWNVLKDEEIGRFLYNWRIKKGYRDNLNNVWLRKMRYGRY